jgi:hypothetical protein
MTGKRGAGGWQQKEHSANAYVIATERSVTMSNPKTELTDNTQKDPDEWVSGDDPMTGAQASYLKTLCEQAGTPEMYDDNLTKAQASKLIDEMREKANVQRSDHGRTNDDRGATGRTQDAVPEGGRTGQVG